MKFGVIVWVQAEIQDISKEDGSFFGRIVDTTRIPVEQKQFDTEEEARAFIEEVTNGIKNHKS